MKEVINQRVTECIDTIVDSGVVKSKRILANILNESPSKITEITKGTRNADTELIYNLWKEFSANPMWIITKQGKPFLNKEMMEEDHAAEQNAPYFNIYEAYDDLKKLNKLIEERNIQLEQELAELR